MKTVVVCLMLTLMFLVAKDRVYTPEIEKIGSIKGNDDDGSTFYQISKLSVDKDENIYIVDSEDQLIKVFDGDGSFKFSFGGRGNGPGETMQAQWVEVFGDFIYVGDGGSKVINKHKMDGEFVERVTFEGSCPEFVKLIDEEHIAGVSIGSEQSDGSFFIVGTLKIYDKDFKEISSIEKFSAPLDITNPQLNPMDFIPSFTADKKSIYYGKVDENRYQINVFDMEKSSKSSIKRRFRKVRMSDQAIKEMERSTSVSTSDGNNSERLDNQIKDKFHKAVQGMWIDGDGNLISMSAGDIYSEKFMPDIFVDGEFKGKVDLSVFDGPRDFGVPFRISFYNDKMYLIARDENDEIVIDIYSYKLSI